MFNPLGDFRLPPRSRW